MAIMVDDYASTSFSTALQLYQDYGQVIMKGYVQRNPVNDRKDLSLRRSSNQGSFSVYLFLFVIGQKCILT